MLNCSCDSASISAALALTTLTESCMVKEKDKHPKTWFIVRIAVCLFFLALLGALIAWQWDSVVDFVVIPPLTTPVDVKSVYNEVKNDVTSVAGQVKDGAESVVAKAGGKISQNPTRRAFPEYRIASRYRVWLVQVSDGPKIRRHGAVDP